MAAYLLLLASGASNFRYGLEVGRTDLEKIIAASASVGADLWLAVAFIFIAATVAKRKFGQAIAATFFAVVALVYAVNAGIGFASTARDAMIGPRAAIERTDKLTKIEFDRVNKKLKELELVAKPTKEQKAEQKKLESARQQELARLRSVTTLASADAQGSTLATYLGLLGWEIAPGDLLPWQTLLFVMLVVTGGPLCLWLAESRRDECARYDTLSVGTTDVSVGTTDANPKLPITTPPPKGGGRKPSVPRVSSREMTHNVVAMPARARSRIDRTAYRQIVGEWESGRLPMAA